MNLNFNSLVQEEEYIQLRRDGMIQYNEKFIMVQEYLDTGAVLIILWKFVEQFVRENIKISSKLYKIIYYKNFNLQQNIDPRR